MSIKNFLIIALIPLGYLIFQLLTIDQYGITTDHDIILDRGEFYFYEYRHQGYAGIYEAIPTAKLRSYGPLANILIVASKHYLHDVYPVFSDPVHAYHFPNIIFSGLAILILGIFIGRIWGLVPAFMAMLVLITIPRFFGHAQTNYKDISTLALFLPCIATFYFAVSKNKLIEWLWAGALLGIFYCIRVHALLVVPIVSLWFFLIYIVPEIKNYFLTKKLHHLNQACSLLIYYLIKMLLVLGIAACFVIMLWPYYRVDPLGKFLETFQVMSGHDWQFKQLYLGENLRADQMPWHYPLVYLSVTLPISYLILLIIGFILTIVAWYRNYSQKSALLLISLSALTPPFAHAVMGTPMYGGIRHWLLIYPFFAALIAYVLWQIVIYFKTKNWQLQVVALLLISLIFINQFYQNSKLFPLTYIYFNSLVGGEANAQNLFTMDIRSQAKYHVDRWLNANGGRENYRVLYARKFNRHRGKQLLNNQTPVYIYEVNGAKLAYIYTK